MREPCREGLQRAGHHAGGALLSCLFLDLRAILPYRARRPRSDARALHPTWSYDCNENKWKESFSIAERNRKTICPRCGECSNDSAEDRTLGNTGFLVWGLPTWPVDCLQGHTLASCQLKNCRVCFCNRVTVISRAIVWMGVWFTLLAMIRACGVLLSPAARCILPISHAREPDFPLRKGWPFFSNPLSRWRFDLYTYSSQTRSSLISTTHSPLPLACPHEVS